MSPCAKCRKIFGSWDLSYCHHCNRCFCNDCLVPQPKRQERPEFCRLCAVEIHAIIDTEARAKSALNKLGVKS